MNLTSGVRAGLDVRDNLRIMMLRSKLRWLIYQPRNGDGGSKSTRGCFAKRVAHLQRDTPSEPGGVDGWTETGGFFLSFHFRFVQ